jgi:hypothetical protein
MSTGGRRRRRRRRRRRSRRSRIEEKETYPPTTNRKKTTKKKKMPMLCAKTGRKASKQVTLSSSRFSFVFAGCRCVVSCASPLLPLSLVIHTAVTLRDVFCLHSRLGVHHHNHGDLHQRLYLFPETS